MTTVGYGDMSPITPIGRSICIITMLTGIIFMSIVVIIIGGNFEASRNNFLKVKDRFEYLRKERQIKINAEAKAHDKGDLELMTVDGNYTRLTSDHESRTWNTAQAMVEHAKDTTFDLA